MGILKTIFGGEKHPIDAIINGIDSSFLTTQEVIEYRLKSYDALKPFKLMQRLLGLWFCIPYISAWAIVFLMTIGGISVPKEAMEMLEGQMAVTVSLITGFYYLGGTISSALSRK